MSLARLIRKQTLTVLGLNSGTSADGVDLALLSISRSARQPRVRFLTGAERRFPRALKTRILALANTDSPTFSDLLTLDTALGEFFGRTAAAFVKKCGHRVDLVVSHGQTVRHLPRQISGSGKQTSASLQLGHIDRIAARTGCVTVGNLRQADLAVDGEGAPITVAAMARLFADKNQSRLIVNIGGIANYFFLPAGGRFAQTVAADCGPGNMLIDALTTRLYQKPYDRNGALARRGSISEPIVKDLLSYVTRVRRGRRSAGREEFGEPLLHHLLTLGNQHALSDSDLIAAASELTVRAIARAITPFLRYRPAPTKLYLTGGGAHNKFLRDRLSAHLPMLPVVAIDTLGLPAGLVEAASFAVLGEAALRSEALPTRFDGKTQPLWWPVSGHIAQPPVKQR